MITAYGGKQYGVCDYCADTWMWDGKTWTELHPATRPPAESGYSISMAYDGAHQNMVLVNKGTWIWDGQNWTERYPSSHPSYLSRVFLGYDTTHQQMIWFGPDAMTSNNVAVPWIWDGTNWASSPTPENLNRVGVSGLIDDPKHKVLLLFVTNGAWAWDGKKWVQIY